MDEKKKLPDEEEKKTPDTHEEKKDESKAEEKPADKADENSADKEQPAVDVRLTRTVRVPTSLRKISRNSQARISPTSRTVQRTHLMKRTRRYSGSKLR